MIVPLPPSKRPVLWLLAALVVISTFESCKRKCPDKPVIDEKLYPVPWNSATIQLSRNLSDAEIRATFPAGARDSIVSIRRCSCDSTLFNVTFPSSFTINGSGDPATVQTGNTGTSGDLDLPAGSVVAINYPLSNFQDSEQRLPSKDEYLSRLLKLPGNEPANAKTVSIGVFDTGLIDDGTYLSGSAWKFPTKLCSSTGVIGGATLGQVGYSFLDTPSGVNYTDDNKYHHGSRVANLIARQFDGSSVIPKIIPFKVLDQHNSGDMFALLCAMETARLNKVQVYNLSLGYYGEMQPLLRKYIQKSLADDPKRYIVVAAGNRSASDTAKDHSDSMFPKFYPAAFSAEFDRLLMVTTIQKPSLPKVEASTRQNYSKLFGWGVLADSADRFELGRDNSYIFGSSFATPILTGRLARLIGEGELLPADKLIQQMTTGVPGSGGSHVRGNRYVGSRP